MNGMNLIEEIVAIFDTHGIETEIIAASVRNPIHVIEAARLGAHIEIMKKTLSLEKPIGRDLDFRVQEMNRETNTIGSKANNLKITEEVLALKNEIEKIREQAQNVE